MAKTKTIRVSEEELAALQAYRQQQGNTVAKEDTMAVATDTTTATAAQQALADAFVAAIERTRPVEKKNVSNRTQQTPWSPAKGVPKVKLKRKMYQHGIAVEDKVHNADIQLLNQVKPGHYCDGYVRVTLRKDRGLDIDYPVRTASQRLKLVNQYGIRSFTELLQRIIDEKTNPSNYRKADDADIYDLDV